MKARIVFITVIIASLIFISSKIAFCENAMPEQGAQPQQAQGEVIQGGAVPETKAAEPETQWVWGEVVTVDLSNKAVFVKYLDYESDQEKEMNISIDDKTTYENVNSIDELTPKDTVSIDYISLDGKNIAKNISVEKPETQAAPETKTPQAEIKPEDIAPSQTEAPTEQKQSEPSVPSGN